MNKQIFVFTTLLLNLIVFSFVSQPAMAQTVNEAKYEEKSFAVNATDISVGNNSIYDTETLEHIKIQLKMQGDAAVNLFTDTIERWMVDGVDWCDIDKENLNNSKVNEVNVEGYDQDNVDHTFNFLGMLGMEGLPFDQRKPFTEEEVLDSLDAIYVEFPDARDLMYIQVSSGVQYLVVNELNDENEPVNYQSQSLSGYVANLNWQETQLNNVGLSMRKAGKYLDGDTELKDGSLTETNGINLYSLFSDPLA